MIVVLFGPSGAGKTTVGLLLAEEPGWRFADADDYHSASNVRKLGGGLPLTDADREPWLDALVAAIRDWLNEGANVVLACSALKRRYRDRLRVTADVRFVYLKSEPEHLESRLRDRTGHFASASLLASQLANLEEPSPGEGAVTVDATLSPAQIVAAIRAALLPDDSR